MGWWSRKGPLFCAQSSEGMASLLHGPQEHPPGFGLSELVMCSCLRVPAFQSPNKNDSFQCLRLGMSVLMAVSELPGINSP